MRSSYKARLASELSAADSYDPASRAVSMLQEQWKGLVWPADDNAVRDPETGVDREVLLRVGRASVAVSEGFVRALETEFDPSNFISVAAAENPHTSTATRE